MISSLVSNKSIEKILFYILLNGRCYATQLHHRLETALTPLQQALEKLEKGGVLISHTEGKTRFFEFNPQYPLLTELESLLKRAYVLLSPQEKKLYYGPLLQKGSARQRSRPSMNRDTLIVFWEKLQKIQSMCFSAKSKSSVSSVWNGLGKGSVEVKLVEETVITFHEKGKWMSEDSKNSKEMDFSNVFRWTLQSSHGVISLEHLRFGPQNPVYLFDLIPVEANVLESVDSHVCESDTYFGQVRCDKHFIQFYWRVIGPKKNEEIDYLYT